jgi:hypothetical protein
MIPSPQVILTQFKMAAVLHNMDLRHSYLLIDLDDSSLGDWRGMLSGTNAPDFVLKRFGEFLPDYRSNSGPDSMIGETRVPAYHLLLSLVFQAMRPSTAYLYSTLVMALARVLLPRLSAYTVDKNHVFPSSATSWVFIALETVQLFTQYLFVTYILCASIIHYDRQARVLENLGWVARFHPEEIHNFPVLNMQQAENVRAWMWLRMTMQHFGARYAQRIRVYLTSVFIYLIVVIVILVVLLGLSPNLFIALNNTFTYWTLQDIFTFGLVLYFATTHGAWANSTYNQHKAMLTKHLESMREQLRRRANTTNLELKRSAECMRLSLKTLKVIDRAYYVSIFGLRADSSLSSTMLTAFGTVFLMFVAQYIVL